MYQTRLHVVAPSLIYSMPALATLSLSFERLVLMVSKLLAATDYIAAAIPFSPATSGITWSSVL
jgi:hypothetical protein